MLFIHTKLRKFLKIKLFILFKIKPERNVSDIISQKENDDKSVRTLKRFNDRSFVPLTADFYCHCRSTRFNLVHATSLRFSVEKEKNKYILPETVAFLPVPFQNKHFMGNCTTITVKQTENRKH